MPDSGLLPSVLFLVGFLIIFAAYAYAGYWGLTIRRRLVVGAYRAQALGVIFVAIYFYVIGLANTALPVDALSSGIPVFTNALVDVGYLGMIMYWIHTTVSVSKRSDPFERDTLRYSSTKYLWVSAVVILLAISLVYNPIGLVITVAVPLSSLFLALGLAPWVVGASFGAILLYLCASRSMDRTLRSHVRWLATYSLVSLLNIVLGAWWREAGGNTGPYGLIILPFFVGGQSLAAYCLYKSAKSLAPITKVL